ncbi:MAG: N-acetyltransferase family protein [Angelakisella sp.]
MIRNATPADAARIAEIYRYYVENTTISFEAVPPDTAEMQARIETYTQHYPYIVYEENGIVVGYCYGSRFRERKAYDPSVELSVYLHKDCCGKGYGRVLVQELLERLRQEGYYTVISTIVADNGQSRKLFESMGFQLIGIYKNIGRKFDRWLDLAEYALPLRPYE